MLATACLAFLSSLLFCRLSTGQPEMLMCPSLPVFATKFWFAYFDRWRTTKFLRAAVPGPRPPRLRLILAFNVVAVKFALLQMLWWLDNLIFPGNFSVEVKKPILVIAAPRTGSTSLHRVLASNKEKFVSANMVEQVFPIISLLKLIYSFRKQFESSVAAKWLVSRTERHPLDWFSQGEEDDFLISSHCWAGMMSFVHQPVIASWLQSNDHLGLPHVGESYAKLHYRFAQKILYMHGSSKTMLFKSHLIHLAPSLAKVYPDARFITIVRPAAAQLCSWWSLQADMSKSVMFATTESAEWTEARLKAQEAWNKDSMDFFGSGSDPSRQVVHFKDFIKDQVGTAIRLYKDWGVEVNEERVTEQIKAAMALDEKHVGDTKSFTNVKPQDIGLTEEEIERRLGKPVKV